MSRLNSSVKLLSLVVAAGSAANVAHAQDWAAPVSGSWFDASKWSPMVVPSGNSAVATLGQAGPYNVSTTGNTLLNLNITNPQASLDLAGGHTLTLVGGYPGTLNNLFGRIVVNTNADYANTGMAIGAPDVTFSGTGSIRLQASASDPSTTTNTAYLYSAGGGTLTMNSGTTLGGFGRVLGLPTTNRGTFAADVSGRPLRVEGATHQNESLYTASNGGVLQLVNTSITQTGAGRLAPGAGSVVHLYGTTIDGGAITSQPTGRVQIVSGTNSVSGITVNGGLDHAGGTFTYVGAGGIALTGGATVLLNTSGDYANTQLRVTAPGTPFTGSGVVRLNSSASDPNTTAQTAALTAEPNASASIGNGVALAGFGIVYSPTTNGGQINADITSRILRIDGTSHQNNTQYVATNGGVLQLVNTTVAQAPGASIRAIGTDAGGTINSTVQFYNVSLTGGTVSSDGLARAQLVGAASATMTGVTIGGGFDVNGGSTLYINNPGITLSGGATLLLNTYADYATTRIITDDASTLIGGAGTVRMNASASDPNATATTSMLARGSGTSSGSFVFAPGVTLAGFGMISDVPTQNSGVFNADINGRPLRINGNSHQNLNLYQATNGGTLVAVGATINQGAAGVIRAGNGSTVVLSNSRVNNGKIDSVGSGAVLIDNTVVTLDNLVIDCPLRIYGNGMMVAPSSLNLSANAVVTVNTNADYANAQLRADGSPTVLTGNGTVTLNASASDPTATVTTADLTRNGDVPDSGFTFGSGIKVNGFGRINGVPTTNNGLIDANINGRPLRIEGATHTNNANYRASGGGSLVLVNTTINQSGAGALHAADNSNVVMYGATVNGGAFTAAGSGRSIVGGTSRLSGISTGVPMDVNGNNALLLNGTAITNTGVITVNTSGDYAGTSVRSESVGAAINGNGEVRLKRSASDGSANVGTADISGSGGGETLAFGPGQKLTGSGGIRLPLTMSGSLSPGVGAGSVDFMRIMAPGSVTFTSNGALVVDIASAGSFDRLVNEASIAVDGTLIVTSAYNATPGSTFDIATGGTITGQFDQVLSYGLTAPKRFGARVDPGRIRVTVLCGLADIGSAGADANGDGELDNNDFIVFIDRFFAQDPAVDFGSAGGEQGADGLFDNNDFIAFIDLFFAGCF